MADKPLKSLTFPDLTDTYTIPETLFESGTGTDSVQQLIPSHSNPNVASGDFSMAVGQRTTASGLGAVAMGSATTASGNGSFAMGVQSGSTGQYVQTVASGNQSVAMGIGVTASGNSSQAFGQRTVANAVMSSAFGNYTISTGRACFVTGQYNVEDTNAVDTSHGSGARKYIAIIGNGTADNARSNALTVDWDGNLVVSGSMSANYGVANAGKFLVVGSDGIVAPVAMATWQGGSY